MAADIGLFCHNPSYPRPNISKSDDADQTNRRQKKNHILCRKKVINTVKLNKWEVQNWSLDQKFLLMSNKHQTKEVFNQKLKKLQEVEFISWGL